VSSTIPLTPELIVNPATSRNSTSDSELEQSIRRKKSKQIYDPDTLLTLKQKRHGQIFSSHPYIAAEETGDEENMSLSALQERLL
jgi:hypothetical protein